MFKETYVWFGQMSTPGTLWVDNGTIIDNSWRRHIKIEEVVDRL
jgi:hypothetical protein